MDALLRRINDSRLKEIVGCINSSNTEKFKEIIRELSEYDPTFLWIISYLYEGNTAVAEYIGANYEKFQQLFDRKFLIKLGSNGNFDAHMWEMILCDVLSGSGVLVPKEKSGADFLLKTPSGQVIQIEAVTPNEAKDPNLRAVRPAYDAENFAELSGEIEDLERPVLLRFMQGFDEKEKEYDHDMPLIIAVNTSKAVGFVSDDSYILRRTLFGLGYVTITKRGDAHFTGMRQNLFLNKPAQDPFTVGRFRDEKYRHVSGVIYTSQKPNGLVPGGFGWGNQGITYIPNPMAHHKATISFPFFRTLSCTEELYEERDAKQKFRSTVIETEGC